MNSIPLEAPGAKVLRLGDLLVEEPEPTPDVLTRLRRINAGTDVLLAERRVSIRVLDDVPEELPHLFRVKIGTERVRLGLSHDLLAWLLQGLEIDLDDWQPVDQPSQLALLIELACLDFVESVERALDAGLVVDEAGTERGDVPLSLEIVTKDCLFKAALELPEQLAAFLADHLEDRNPMQPSVQQEPKVNVTFSAGCQYVTASELKDLAPGDIIVLEPGTSVASLLGKVEIPTELMPDGFSLKTSVTAALQAPDPLARPHPGWIRLTALCGSLVLSLDALENMHAEAILPFPRLLRTPIDLIAPGFEARGILVKLGDGMGVRVASVLRCEIAQPETRQ